MVPRLEAEIESQQLCMRPDKCSVEPKKDVLSCVAEHTCNRFTLPTPHGKTIPVLHVCSCCCTVLVELWVN